MANSFAMVTGCCLNSKIDAGEYTIICVNTLRYLHVFCITCLVKVEISLLAKYSFEVRHGHNLSINILALPL